MPKYLTKELMKFELSFVTKPVTIKIMLDKIEILSIHIGNYEIEVAAKGTENFDEDKMKANTLINFSELCGYSEG